ncbi:DUF397 domain-containing protein [Saccharopolyspora gloriosae]|uniref:DUF397 domain-containing protein n=1 Tax=Saccharopolyspora gloriosae TaxID=455344 RepID=UPI001FB58F5C|nr:DUF397 domain-containing protein [Saccharopolyspora gloriosae]
MTEQDLTGATWFKSSYSPTQNECVEVALAPGGAGVRDTKDRNGGTLTFDTAAWTTFLSNLKQS